MNKNTSKLLALLLTGIVNVAQAQEANQPLSFMGTGGGNGGDILVLKDDSVKLAESYIVDAFAGITGKEYRLPVEVITGIRRVGGLINAYSTSTENSLYRSNRFVDRNLLDKRVEYIAVDEVPAGCRQATYRNLPESSILLKTMCTEGFKTFVDTENLSRLNVRKMSVLFAHEGLHREGLAYRDIGVITSTLEMLLSHYQRQLNGEKTTLTEDEVKAIKTMAESVNYYDLNGSGVKNIYDEYQVWPYGGGLVHKEAQIDGSAFVGIGSRVGPKSVVGKDAVVIRTDCGFHKCELAQNAKVMDVKEMYPESYDSLRSYILSLVECEGCQGFRALKKFGITSSNVSAASVLLKLDANATIDNINLVAVPFIYPDYTDLRGEMLFYSPKIIMKEQSGM